MCARPSELRQPVRVEIRSAPNQQVVIQGAKRGGAREQPGSFVLAGLQLQFEVVKCEVGGGGRRKGKGPPAGEGPRILRRKKEKATTKTSVQTKDERRRWQGRSSLP